MSRLVSSLLTIAALIRVFGKHLSNLMMQTRDELRITNRIEHHNNGRSFGTTYRYRFAATRS